MTVSIPDERGPCLAEENVVKHFSVFRQITLGACHRPTGRTRHFVGGAALPSPAGLQIVQFREDPGYYLMYIHAHGKVLTDTYHSTIQDAFDQANWEFGVEPSEWEPQRASADSATRDSTIRRQ